MESGAKVSASWVEHQANNHVFVNYNVNYEKSPIFADRNHSFNFKKQKLWDLLVNSKSLP
jgi:hypothetical protein